MSLLTHRLEQADASLAHFYDRSLLALPVLRNGKSAQLPGRRSIDKILRTLDNVPSELEDGRRHFRREKLRDEDGREVRILGGSFRFEEAGRPRRFSLKVSTSDVEVRLAIEEIAMPRVGPTTVEAVIAAGERGFTVNFFDRENFAVNVSRRGQAHRSSTL